MQFWFADLFMLSCKRYLFKVCIHAVNLSYFSSGIFFRKNVKQLSLLLSVQGIRQEIKDISKFKSWCTQLVAFVAASINLNHFWICIFFEG